MAVEIENQCYEFLRIFIPSSPTDHTERAIRRYLKRDVNTSVDALSPSPPREEEKYKKPPFRYNPLHDLESLWWIAVYFIVVRVTVHSGNPEPPEPISGSHRVYATNLFSDRDIRLWTMINDGRFLQDTEDLPKITAELILALENLREVLSETYRTLEYDFSSPDTIWGADLADYFAQVFELIAGAEEIQPLTVRPFPHYSYAVKEESEQDSEHLNSSTSSSNSRKRGRDATEETPVAAEQSAGRRTKKVKAKLPRRPYLHRRTKEHTRRS